MPKKFNSIGQGILTDAEQKTKKLLNAQVIVELPMEQVVENPDNEWLFGMEKIDKLADTINEEGFSGAIEVIKVGEEQYEISAGHRRYAAMKKLGKTTIPAIIIPGKDEPDKARHLLSSNINNREITPLMYSRMIPYYVEKVLKPNNFKGDKRKELARFFGMSEAQIQRFTRLSNLIPELQELTENPQFPWSRIMKAAYQEQDVQYEIYDEIKKYLDEYPDEFNSKKIEMICDLVVQRVERRKKEEERIKLVAADEVGVKNNVETSSEPISESYEKTESNQPVKNEVEQKTNSISGIEFESKLNNRKMEGLNATALDLPVYNGEDAPASRIVPNEDSSVYAESILSSAIVQARQALSLPIKDKKEIEEWIEELEELVAQLKKKI